MKNVKNQFMICQNCNNTTFILLQMITSSVKFVQKILFKKLQKDELVIIKFCENKKMPLKFQKNYN